MMIKNKKGFEWTLKTVGELIVMIIVFGVALIFLSGFTPYKQVDKKVCHESVVYKATVPEVEGIKAVDIPLRCKTEKICIASGVLESPLSWDNCNEDYQGEEYETMRISGSDKEKQDQINQIIAEKLAECWSMMAEGKLNIYSRSMDYGEKRYCNICTRIAFGKELKGKITQVEGTQNYLKTHFVPNSQKTYWQYITNSESNYIYDYEEKNDHLSTEPKAIVFMESEKSVFFKWLATFAGGAAGGLIGTAVGPVTTAAGVGVGGALGGDLGSVIDEYLTGGVPRISSMDFVDYRGLKEKSCTSFEGEMS